MTNILSELVTVLNQMASLESAELQASLDSITLHPAQIQALHQLANHFVGPGVSSLSAPSTQPTPASNNPWKAFRRCDHLMIPGAYQDILGSGPQRFVDSYRDATVHHSLVSSSRHAQQQSVQRLRELFGALALYDVGRTRFPRCSGNRLSDRMKDELKSLLPGCDAVEQYKVGKNLDHICNVFGLGCVFYLAKYLSNDFLYKKFTASGAYYNGAIRHLNALGLKKLAKESGANEFARQARILSVAYLEMKASVF